ncbi:MAG: DUF1778 domain-containing protein [Deltaproteobacteria bacterium]|nr:DUF1778 domain-containing protein [Deltaproteobacteria bacterium]
MTAIQNNPRVSARVTPNVYETLSRAAELTGSTLNQFIVQSAYEKAQSVIENERFIKMTDRSASAFFEALDNPPKPTVKLKKAIRKYRDPDNAIEN